ncbi:HlyD family efflux transporter periplasmic adaptor subunit [Shewanella yunxiaonensis]|uniref:HlyD family efflux transporter periplasmic adaptor subunit n=1 Tax=Shewanella yunxiaonensis TaxID=2829809 RepID=A0ABX7YRF2_9GAMM|nr:MULTISPECIES: HlyD family efflux transporter periplasmic adaptor subunit [Shewanella]MDF0535537.1 HlyD family efflux transporter periplasmic adaptor subunit [Shewanella sp. A32]QUN05312.1 HlyD family efflux transporter periplasmic adaptor subunit [Shewanella yunxiaonensis]
MTLTKTEQPFDAARASASRKKGFVGLAVAMIFAAVIGGSYWYFVASHYVSTDNAYTATEIAAVTPAVSGIVAEVKVLDTEMVQKGDVLVVLDDTDARLAYDRAKANYALAKRQVSSYVANDEGLQALVKAREADEQRAKAELVVSKADYARAQLELQRRENLVTSGAVSGEELTNAKTAFAQAEANLNAAKAAEAQAVANRLSSIGNKKANAALIIDTTVDTNPQVLQAKAQLQQAEVDLRRTVIRAPVAGVIAKRQVQIGERVQIGTPLMTVVPVQNMHVDANFKEVELRQVKIGQPVEVTADIYGDKVIYHGVVTGLSGGTGSAFSAIPAQNATGNWIKVVQRLPVRIGLDPSELAAHPLQVGLSMEVTINTAAQPNINAITAVADRQLPINGRG